MWHRAAAVFLAATAFLSLPAFAQTLYAASVRTLSGSVGGIAGSLYTVNLGTGTATFVAPIRLNAATPIGITGLAAHPQTGVFYGITSALGNAPQSLVTIDPQTGNATLVGETRLIGSDVAFSRAGILYIWLPATAQLGVVNITSGAVTPIGPARAAGPPAGLSIDGEGKAYVTGTGASGTLDVVDLASGQLTPGPALENAPFPTSINSMTFTPSGLLLAVNSNAGSPAATRLVQINVATGAVASIGTLPDDTDALTFAPLARRDSLTDVNVQTLALMVLGVIALILGLIGWFVGRRPAH